MDTIGNIMNIDHISISREGVWRECQQRYKYKYHLQVLVEQPTPFYFTFGKLVHRIIEEHTKCRGEKSVPRIKKDILNGHIEFQPNESVPSLDRDQYERLTLHLNNYMKLANKIGYDGHIEWPFLFDLDAPNKRCIKGFLDRLIIKDDRAFILDWKTTKPSRWRKDSRTITSDLQLAAYCYIVNKTFNIPAKNIKAALYYLEDAKLVPVSFGQPTLETVPNRLLKIYKEIEKADPDKVKGTVGDHCRRCDYRKICCWYSLL